MSVIMQSITATCKTSHEALFYNDAIVNNWLAKALNYFKVYKSCLYTKSTMMTSMALILMKFTLQKCTVTPERMSSINVSFRDTQKTRGSLGFSRPTNHLIDDFRGRPSQCIKKYFSVLSPGCLCYRRCKQFSQHKCFRQWLCETCGMLN